MDNANGQAMQYRTPDMLIVASPYFRRTIRKKDAMAIIERVARESGVTVKEIMSRELRRDVAATRIAAIRAVAAAYPGVGSTTLGRLFDRDHTTILAALGKVRKRRAVDKADNPASDIATA